MRLEVMSLDELRAWSPPGTVTVTYQVPADRRSDAEKALRSAGFRVAPASGRSVANDGVVLDVFRHYGIKHPGGDVQQEHMDHSETALNKVGIEPVHLGTSLTFAGGTPGHRWLQVAVNGVATDLKVLAATEVEADGQLDQMASFFARAGIPREALSVVRPDGWPVVEVFGSASFPT